MGRERKHQAGGFDAFVTRLVERFELPQSLQEEIKRLHESGTSKAEIFRLASTGRGMVKTHWSGNYKEGEPKSGTRLRAV